MLATRWGSGGVGLALLLASGVAHATPAARLVYSRTAEAASCPDETALRKAVATRVGYDAFFPWAPRTVVVAIVRREGSFAATVDLVDEGGIDHGAHELHTQRACVDLLDAVALAVAIAIDPQAAMAAPAAASLSPPPPAPDPPPAMPPPVEVAAPVAETGPSQEPRPVVRFESSGGVVASVGTAPDPVLGGALGVAARWSRFSVGLEGQLTGPSTTAVGSSSASVSLVTGALVPCVSFGAFLGCVVAQAGSLQSSATGLGTHSTSNVWGALGGRFGVLVPVTTQLSLRGRIDVLGDLSPTKVKLDGVDPWTASPVAGTLGIDVVWRF